MLHENHLLNRLSPDTLARIIASLKVVDLPQSRILAESDEAVHKVYFPHSGILSCLIEIPGGGAIETGMIGKDGVFGAIQALNDTFSLNQVVVQVAARVSVMNSDRFRELAQQLPALKILVTDYDQFFFAQVQQTAACNAVHDIEARACKWLLRMYDLAGPHLPLTQDFLAQMIGVRRTSVTAVAQVLQEKDLITYRRGHVQIADLDKLKQVSCVCHRQIRSHYEQLFGSHTENVSGFSQSRHSWYPAKL